MYVHRRLLPDRSRPTVVRTRRLGPRVLRVDGERGMSGGVDLLRPVPLGRRYRDHFDHLGNPLQWAQEPPQRASRGERLAIGLSLVVIVVSVVLLLGVRP
jgi:hypothetical protein